MQVRFNARRPKRLLFIFLFSFFFATAHAVAGRGENRRDHDDLGAYDVNNHWNFSLHLWLPGPITFRNGFKHVAFPGFLKNENKIVSSHVDPCLYS